MPRQKAEPSDDIQAPTLDDAFGIIWDTACNRVSSINLLPIVYGALTISVLTMVALRFLAPKRFIYLFNYLTMFILWPVCCVCEVTVVPVLRFINRRLKEEEDDREELKRSAYMKRPCSEPTPPAN